MAWAVAGLVSCSSYIDTHFPSCNSDLHGVPNCVSIGLPRYACCWFGCSRLKKVQVSNLARGAKYAALLVAHACHHTWLWSKTLFGAFFFKFDTVISVNIGYPRIRYSVSISRCLRPPGWSQCYSLSLGLPSLLYHLTRNFNTRRMIDRPTDRLTN
jgi:hypothetical protein